MGGRRRFAPETVPTIRPMAPGRVSAPPELPPPELDPEPDGVDAPALGGEAELDGDDDPLAPARADDDLLAERLERARDDFDAAVSAEAASRHAVVAAP